MGINRIITPNFLWFKISKQDVKTLKDIYVCGVYIPPNGSKYFLPEMFEDLENGIETFYSQGSILLMGDFNSRTGKYSDCVSQKGNTIITNDQSHLSSGSIIEIVLTTTLTITANAAEAQILEYLMVELVETP